MGTSSQTHTAIPKALTHFSHRASGVGEFTSSGSQLLAHLSEASLDPKAFLCLPGDRLPLTVPPKSQTLQKKPPKTSSYYLFRPEHP